MISNKKGFTLIEMLIVIAIIGILSAAVLAGLGPSRNKAKDARVISGMNQIRAIAETVYDPSIPTPYKGLLLNDSYTKAKDDIASQGTTLNAFEIEGGQNYIAYVQMLATDSWYCIDSFGFAGTRQPESPPSSGQACDGTPWPGGAGGE